MATKIEKIFEVQGPIEKVWAFLSDPYKVVTCVPGAKITEKVDDRNYKGSISVKVGPSVTDFKGEIQIISLDEQKHEIEILGKGQDVRGKGSASMKMTGKLLALDDGGTEVTSISELNVVGILAQMGSRVISEVSNVLFEKFTKNFQQQLQAPEPPTHESNGEASNAETPAPPKPISAVSVAMSALKSAMTRDKK